MLNDPLFVSVVIPVLNEGTSVGAVVQSLLDQEYPTDKFEILVVDGGSSDNTLAVASRLSSEHRNVKVLLNPGRLSSAGRNVGARAARGEVVLFVDGHCEVPDKSLLKNLSLLYRKTGADIMCRPQPLQTAGLTDTQRAIALSRASWLGHNPVSLIYDENEEGYVDPESCGAAYTRRVFDRIGYFDESFDACEDVDFNLRARKAGLKAYTSPRLTVRYRPRETNGALFRQMMRYGAGRASLFAKHPRQGLPGAAMLGAPVVVTIALAAASTFWADAGYVFLWLVLAYVVVVVATSVTLSVGKGMGFVPRVLAAFLAIHAGLVAGFWTRFFRGGLAGRLPAAVPAQGRPDAPEGGER